MKALILFAFLIVQTSFCVETVVQSVPQLRFTSTALFSSLSNQGIDQAFMSCPSGYFLYGVKARFSTAGKFSPCVENQLNTQCQTAGDTTGSLTYDLGIGDTLYLGFNPLLRSYKASELSVLNRFDGTFLAERYCADVRYSR